MFVTYDGISSRRIARNGYDGKVKQGFDIGLGFDGDGDRLGVIDNQGNIVWADQYMLLLCSEIANLYDKPKIIMDVKCSKVFFDEAKKINCEPIMSRTGHSPIKEKMKELNSPLSGEMSGHVCYGDDFYGYDDATVSYTHLTLPTKA